MSDKKYQITITPVSNFIPEQSDESSDRYIFAYTITITNNGEVTAQLVSRRWLITDSNQQTQEVQGMGVVGEQPRIKPGESYEYTSGTALATPVGTMSGSYQMVAEDGHAFDAEIPEFVLSMPRVLH